ncbi:Hypothetical protein R9X50_00746400 [Acrodontium crateriforme]|uniref:Uncharacterized protein n=1 Tax=Acrodontium crateriforme TaxID=150365 RepID=A0AAQ3M9S9_9PEZI|nr:Hypothetical protein R9X50_00746400 [Acrodontium crateriforme]
MFTPQQHGGYQGPPPHFQPGATHHGPPPAKKVKGNPVITRYAPPPGYVPPPAGHPHMAATQQPHSYPPYGSFNTADHYAVPQQIYPNQQPLHAAAGYPPQHMAHPQHHTPTYPTWQQPPITAPQSAPPQAWSGPQNPYQHHSAQPRRNSVPVAYLRSASGEILDGNGDVFPAEDSPASGTVKDVEGEYWEECYYARNPEDIDPDFSIGQIIWLPPAPTKLPLPNTFIEAEKLGLSSRSPDVIAPGTNCTSFYFIGDRSEEPFLSVKQLDRWNDIKHDPVFKEFPTFCENYVTMSELLDQYRSRPDPNWSLGRSPSPFTEPQLECQSRGRVRTNDKMDVDSPMRREQADDISSLDGFEQGLKNRDREYSRNRGRHSRNNSKARSHSRANSVASFSSQNIRRPVPLPAVRDQAQDEVLAALGVEGSPKTVYQTPGPAFGAPPSATHSRVGSRAGSATPSSRHVSGGSISDSIMERPHPPPPPPIHEHPSYNGTGNPRGQHGDYHRRGSQSQHNGNGHYSRPHSSHSQHTTAGSDFQPDDDTTPRAQRQQWSHNRQPWNQGNDRRSQHHNSHYPQSGTPNAQRFHRHHHGSGNRKRSLEITGDEGDENRRPSDYNDDTPRRQEDDVTPRQQRKKLRPPRVDEAYSRRW